jgi:hypothetical protein
MVRMQIQFTEAQSRRLRDEAAERGVSISAVVRTAVEESLVGGRYTPSRDELLERSLAAMGQFSSGTGDVSLRHDEYFADSAEG